MDALRLDEAQGVTFDMLRGYMLRSGWRDTNDAIYDCLIHDTLRPASGSFTLRQRTSSGQWAVMDAFELGLLIRDLAVVEGRSIQSLLREMNPRMRKGKPSTAALMAHQGNWIVRDDETGSLGVYPSHMMGYSSREDCLSFWPCDEHGNKIPWPERDGVML